VLHVSRATFLSTSGFLDLIVSTTRTDKQTDSGGGIRNPVS